MRSGKGVVREQSRIAEARPGGSRRRWFVLAALIVLALSGFACSSVRYVSQSLTGGARILLDREPIHRLLQRDDLDARLRTQLEAVERIRAFAEAELGLPVGKAYGAYVETGRRYVVWNVVAAPADSVVPRTWCFPIAGCVAYRGYFREEHARRYAERIAADGWDVSVGGVTAYSTLGWFADPVLDTFAFLPEVDLAGLIFHELAHRRLYVPGDTAFNESFAGFVERLGEGLYVEAQGPGGTERFGADALTRRALLRQRSEVFTDLVLGARSCLEQVYAAETSDASKADQKQRIFDRLRSEYEAVRAEWVEETPDGPLWDAWFERELNNAHVASVGSYTIWIDAFTSLYEQTSDLPTFFDGVSALAALDAGERRAALEGLAPARERRSFSCPSAASTAAPSDASSR